MLRSVCVALSVLLTAHVARAASIPPSVGPWQYKGCFVDNPYRRLKNQLGVSGGMTVEKCVAACKAQGYPVAGLEFGSQCWCDFFMRATNPKPDSDCQNMVCSGDSNEYCAGPDRLGVYVDSSVPLPSTTTCAESNTGNFNVQAVPKSNVSAPVIPLDILDVGTPAGTLIMSPCEPNCQLSEGVVQNSQYLIRSNKYPSYSFTTGVAVVAGESPTFCVGNNCPFPSFTGYCSEISPYNGLIGPVLLAANTRSDLWALCPNKTTASFLAGAKTTAGHLSTDLRNDLVYSPVANHAHYDLGSCTPVWLQLQYYEDNFSH